MSSDHHHALRLASTIHRATSRRTLDQPLAGEVEDIYHRELLPHFAIEEQVLLPALKAVGATELANRTRAEHRELRRLLDAAAFGDFDSLTSFATLLEAHVRFEERELFPACEARLPSRVLDDVSRRNHDQGEPDHEHSESAPGLHSIGLRPRQVEREPAALLLECHQRIRDFCTLARRLTEPGISEDVTAEAAGRVHRYFIEALPLHAADEDETLEPRLRGRSSVLDAALDRMSREHQVHQPLVARLCELTRVLADNPAELASISAELSTVALQLEDQLLDHIEHEERTIIPAIAEYLPPRTRESIVAQFAARRHAKPQR